MNKIRTIIAGAVIVCLMFVLAGCGENEIDWSALSAYPPYSRAIIRSPDGEIIDVKIKSWDEYNGQYIIYSTDGKAYGVAPYNVLLIAEET